MRILFYHQNYPAQFGHVAVRFAREPGCEVAFASQSGPAEVPGVTRVLYAPSSRLWQTCSHSSWDSLRSRQNIINGSSFRRDRDRPAPTVGHRRVGADHAALVQWPPMS